MKLPNPAGKHLEQQPPVPMRVPFLDEMGSVFKAVKKRDILLHFPYESFDYLIRFLMEAAFDPKVDEIKTDLDVYVSECQAKFITGEMSFDEWDNYCSTLETLGIEELVSYYQTYYDSLQ